MLGLDNNATLVRKRCYFDSLGLTSRHGCWNDEAFFGDPKNVSASNKSQLDNRVPYKYPLVTPEQ